MKRTERSEIAKAIHGKVERFLEVESKNGKKYLLWKLVKCRTCGSIHNRDNNATKNFQFIVEETIKGKSRPKIFKKTFPNHEV